MRKRPESLVVLALIVLSFFVASSTPDPIHSQSFAILSSNAVVGSTQYRMVQYPLPKGSTGPWSIASDGAGSIWVVEQGSNQLASFDPSTSTFQEYPIPTSNSTAGSVTTDSAGNVWLTELTSNKLGELKNGSSRIVEYSIPNGTTAFAGKLQALSCGPTGVVLGPHNEIWILCLFSNQIDEFFPSSETFASFNLPVFQSGPAGLVFDHSGNFWFTAADVNKIGHGTVSQLKNDTSDGIEETAPQNATYTFNFQHTIDMQGNTENVKSSLPTPSGIGLSPDGKTLWISEHVDSSFDSYNIQTKSLDRYWTSQTYGAYGYSVSFPNGLAVDAQGNVWIAEHYGNRVAEFNPSTNSLTEYAVPCCGSSSAGVYTLTLGKNGTVWFVEILGGAIGELEPVSADPSLRMSMNTNQISIGQEGTATIRIELQSGNLSSSIANNVTLGISGTSSTGSLSGATAKFSPSSLMLSGSATEFSNLTLSFQSLKSGIYDFTVSAILAQQNVTYSAILKVVIGSIPSPYEQLFVYAGIVGIIASIVVIGVLAGVRHSRGRLGTRRKRRR